METAGIILIILILINILLAVIDLKRGMKSKGWEDTSEYNKLFNARTVATVTVEVIRQEKITPMKGMTPAIQLLTKTETEVIPAHLGPAWFVENQRKKIEPKEKVELRGSKIILIDKPIMMVSELRIGDDVFTLRDHNGNPVWNAWKRRR